MRRVLELDDERALVVRVQHGDREAFDMLARRFARPAYTIAYRILRHRQDAEDLVQEAFLAALDGIGTFELGRPFAPWFFRIVVNRGLNARGSRAARERFVHVTDTVEDEIAAERRDGAERAEIRERFQEALEALPERQRIIVQMADVDGRSSLEIGQLLGIPRGTVRWHLHQARHTLRGALAALYGRDS